MNNTNKGKVFFGNDCCEVRACSFINISKSELKEFIKILQALGQNIKDIFQNPSQSNIDKLIATLDNLQKFLKCLDLSPAQEKIGTSIITNLLTILKTKPFSCGALYVELQSLLNFLLYIAKLFKVDCCTIDKLVKLITEIQTILVKYGSGFLGGGATGAKGGFYRTSGCSRRYWDDGTCWYSDSYNYSCIRKHECTNSITWKQCTIQ
jgi:hypothetical protein